MVKTSFLILCAVTLVAFQSASAATNCCSIKERAVKRAASYYLRAERAVERAELKLERALTQQERKLATYQSRMESAELQYRMSEADEDNECGNLGEIFNSRRCNAADLRTDRLHDRYYLLKKQMETYLAGMPNDPAVLRARRTLATTQETLAQAEAAYNEAAAAYNSCVCS